MPLLCLRGTTMRSLYSLPLALATSIALSGCASNPPAEPQIVGEPFEVSQFEPDLRDHYTSWGHEGRGGAALRKPAYQPVLGSQDLLEARNGKLHPELQPRPSGSQASVEVPPGLYASKCPDNSTIAKSFALNVPATSDRITTLANSKGTVDDYIRVRNKLCKGALRLTYEEWQILVEGTPKDVPQALQPRRQTHQK